MSITRRALVALAVSGSAALTGCQTAAPTPAQPTAAAPTSAAQPAATGKCTLTELTASLGRTTGEAGQRHTIVVWTNTSGTACTVTGFGGVDLVGPDDPPFGGVYSLPRQAGQAATITLAPGAKAHSTITWLPPQDGPGWTPTGMNVTPPDETRSAGLDWPGGAVLRQDGATHPGTFLSPVQAGADG
jgi:hypothetical protein